MMYKSFFIYLDNGHDSLDFNLEKLKCPIRLFGNSDYVPSFWISELISCTLHMQPMSLFLDKYSLLENETSKNVNNLTQNNTLSEKTCTFQKKS